MSDLDSILATYARDGFVVAPSCLPVALIDEYRAKIREVVARVASATGVPVSDSLSLDEAFNRLCDANRAYGGMVYDCMRFHPLMQELAAHPGVVDVAKRILNATLFYHVHDQLHFRIDRANEDRFALSWHQDYWYNNTTSHAVTVWIPLGGVPLEKGPIRFLPGSHHAPLPVVIDEGFRQKWDQNRLFQPADPIPFEAGVDAPCAAGAAVFIHAQSVHRSGQNTTASPRFTAVFRYSDLLHDELVSKRWKSGIRVGWSSLLEQRPDLIRNLEALKEPGTR